MDRKLQFYSVQEGVTGVRITILLLIALASFFLSGCAVKHMVVGEYYLTSNKYNAGIDRLEQELRANPGSASINYYLGRYHLAEEDAKSALPYLKRAAQLSPRNADYHFWQGVAYGVDGQQKNEQLSYEKALNINHKHIQALVSWQRPS